MTVVGYYEFYKDVKMKIGNIGKLPILIFITITLGTVNTSLTIGDDQPDFVLAGIKDNFSNPGYKPVSDTCPYVEEGGKLNDNFLYKKWCEETFL